MRSDYQSFQGDPSYALGNQCHTFGLASWIPYFGQGAYYNPDQLVYAMRSHFCPAFGMACDVRASGIDWDKCRRLADDWRAIADDFFGDYYPLTAYSLDNTAWIAWQFNRPECGQGMIQVFRRAESPYESARFPLRGLDPAARYAVTNRDLPGSTTMTGRELMQSGLKVVLSDRPTAAIIVYKKIK